MADTTVLQIKLEDVGASIKGVNKDLKDARSSYTALEKQMSKGAGGSKPKSSYKNAMMGNTEYDIARGSAGATGASGRDFANQARGLDGLVRLYATYAANVFAAGAAFRALSEAADTSNMIQGMNQLGAASGLALGTIAKKLMEATDGAISMREAMEATTKGTAAGLTAKQMEQLGQVANKASKALGIAMPDAISRLTRGISKLEPELLDELGLFTKIGPATENYARSIGKATGSLSDFERRQAFANAVLKEGIDKFNSIDIPANPYDKLLASLKNLSFAALDIVNKALTPLVNILSQNPTILLGVLATIGTSIVKSAIPALGQYRDNLKKTADESRAIFSKMYADQQDKISDMASLAGAKAEMAFKKLPATLSKIEELSKRGATFSNTKKMDYAALAGKDPFAITPEEIKSLDRRANYLATRNAEESARLKKHIAELKAIRASAAAAGSEVSEGIIKSTEGRFTTPGSNDIIQRRTLNKLASDTIRSTVAETQAIYGSRAAYAKLNEEIAKARSNLLKIQTGVDENGKAMMTTAPKMGAFQAGFTRTTAIVGIAAQKIGSLVSAFGHIGMAIGAAIGTFVLLDSFLTKTEKQAGVFNNAIQATSDAVDNANRTLTALAKQPGIATASIQGFLALSNASNTTTTAIETQLEATKDLLAALNSSLWDRAKDRIASLFGQDVATQSAKKLATTVQSQLQLFRAAGLGEQAEAGFKKAIGVNSLDIDTVTKAFKNGTATQEEFAKSQKGLSVKLAESSSKLQDFKTATDGVTKAYEEFIQSTASSNPLFKVGAALEDLSLSMDKLSSGSIQEINAAFNDLVDNPKKIAQFGKEFINQFVGIRQEFKTTLQDYSAYAQSIAAIQDRIDQVTEQKKNAKDIYKPVMAGRGMGTQVITAETQRKEADVQLGFLGESKKILDDKQQGLDTEIFVKARDLFTKGVTNSFEKGAEFIRIALGQASEKAGITIAQASLGALTGARAAQENTRIKQQELKLQMDQVKSTIDLIASNTLLTATMAESNALQADAMANKSGAPREVRSEAGAALTASKIFKNAVSEVSVGRMKPEDLDKILTGNTQVDKYIQQALIPFKRQIAQQRATGIEIGGKQKAASIEGARAEALGKLEDLNKQRNLESDINQQLSARIDILASIDALNGAQRVRERADLEDKILNNKQLQERQGYETAISNAKALNTVKGNEEAKVQEGLLTLVKDRQKIEKDNKAFSDRVKIKAAELDTAIKLNALNEALTDQDIARLGIVSSLIGFSSEQNVLATTRLENEKLENKFTLERKKIEEDIKLLQSDTTKDNSKSIALQQTNLALVTARQEKEKDNKGLQDALKLVEARFDLEQKLAGFRKTAADAQSQQAEDELNYRKELGLVTGFDAVKEKANIDRGRVARETAQEQANIDKDIAKKTLLEQKILEIEASGDSALAGDYEAVNNMTRAIDGQSAALDATNKQKLNAIDLNEKLGNKMTGFSKIVEGSFQSMADALADFARTGKLDFKSLVDSMIVELIRFELRAQMSSLFTAAGGLSGLMKFIGFGGASGMGASPDGINVGNNLLVQAKGGAYDTGLKTFAKGGMFTNSVVSQPTLFKFAQGTGLMGEAGPEAIMPLKRDSNGNLGVRGPGGSGGNVDVVVNNYGNEKATTKETTDSRGNRRIEVIVGDMVASELSRPGSSVQQSLSSNYGNKPSVARR
jgi:lambda family phage tail tape measure protein